ncbi:MAG: FecR domain-containing protein, partial [Rhodospirillales bacterium]|nr:FecR domain-containing protein [Acetobacter sp.]
MRLPAQADYAAAGALNFTEGEVNIDGQPLASRGTGAADAEGGPRRLRVGQTLATAHGSADLLLAPGALLRLGENTTVQMVSADGGRTEVRLEDGRANVSVHVVRKDHLLLVDLPNGQTQILSGGLYTFNAAGDALHVYNGEAFVFPGSDTATDVKPITVKEGHEVALGGEKPRPEKFDREVADDD